MNKEITLRNVTPGDADILFTWANDEAVRSNAIQTGKISWDGHVAWLHKKLLSSSVLLILEIDNTPAGQIRFDFDDKEEAWFIDYSISKQFRGQKLGKRMVEEGLKILDNYPVVALVRKENMASIKVFELLNFRNAGTLIKENVQLLKFIKSNGPAA